MSVILTLPIHIFLVEKINHADIRRGALARGLQMRVGSSKMAIFAYFTRHVFGTFTSKATIIILRYVVATDCTLTVTCAAQVFSL